MPAHTKYMDPDERAEWAEMLDESLNGSRQADQPAIDRLEAMLAQAERAGRVWPGVLQRQWLREGCRTALKDHAKAQARVEVAYNGRVVTKSARRGVRVIGPDGTHQWQQKLFASMTWDEFDESRKLNLEQIESLRINEVAAQRIAALRVLVPDSTGPQDAADRLGTSLEAVLADAA